MKSWLLKSPTWYDTMDDLLIEGEDEEVLTSEGKEPTDYECIDDPDEAESIAEQRRMECTGVTEYIPASFTNFTAAYVTAPEDYGYILPLRGDFGWAWELFGTLH